MSRPRRLSLRTRMLVLMISVVSAFLLVMGTVSTVFIGGHLAALFTQNLQTAATDGPGVLAAAPRDYAAVQVTVIDRPRSIRRLTVQAVEPLTSKANTTQELVAAVRKMSRGPDAGGLPAGPQGLRRPGDGPRTQAPRRLGPARRRGCTSSSRSRSAS